MQISLEIRIRRFQANPIPTHRSQARRIAKEQSANGDAGTGSSPGLASSHCTPSQDTHIYPSDISVQDSTLQWRDRSDLPNKHTGFPIKSYGHLSPSISICYNHILVKAAGFVNMKTISAKIAPHEQYGAIPVVYYVLGEL